MDTSQVLLYYFSTVAQVFASILGVGGLFAVFRLEQIKQIVSRQIDALGLRVTSYYIFPKEMQRHRFDPKRESIEISNFRFTLQWLLEIIPELKAKAEDREHSISALNERRKKGLAVDPADIREQETSVLSIHSVIKQITETSNLNNEIQIIIRDLSWPMVSIAVIVVLSILGILLLQLTLFKNSPGWPNSLAILVLAFSIGTIFRVISLILKWTGSEKEMLQDNTKNENSPKA